MTVREQYTPGPASGAQVRKDRGQMGAAGWHICFDVLDRLLAGQPIGRIVGPEAMKFGWQRLHTEYAKQFGIETPNWPPQAAQKS